ncbi:MAG: hypothetical protein ACFFCZ_19625 [Promethearchaeota archaeon]
MPGKLSRRQLEVLTLLSDKDWIYISKFPKSDRAALIAMEKYGFIQVRGRDKYDFSLWGQVRRTRRGKRYVMLAEMTDDDEDFFAEEEEAPIARPKRSRRKPSRKTRGLELNEEDDQLSLEQIEKIKDPDIRRKLLLRRARRERLEETGQKKKEDAEDKEEQDAWEVEMHHEYDGEHDFDDSPDDPDHDDWDDSHDDWSDDHDSWDAAHAYDDGDDDDGDME